MKKIQVNEVTQTASVQVIYVNSPLTSKVVRAQCALESIKQKIEEKCMNLIKKVDDDGNVKEELVYTGNGAQLTFKETIDLRESVIAFIDEITTALEEA